jgi:hypothetical protein
MKKNSGKHMSVEQVEYIASMSGFSSVEKIGILGGEPSLHPNLPYIISLLYNKNPTAAYQLFSGCCENSAAIEGINIERLVFVANCIDKKSPNIQENLNVVKRKGWDVALSYTVSHRFDARKVVNFCRKNEINIVRWSFAMPSFKAKNAYIPLKQYGELLQDAYNFVQILLRAKIAAYNDCPIPPCYSLRDSNRLNIGSAYYHGIRFGSCSPEYDIYPDYIVEGCMGIGDRVKLDLRNFSNIYEIEEKYSNILRTLIDKSTCGSCTKCHGGCYGFKKDHGVEEF